MTTARLRRLPTVVLALLLPLVALVTVVVTLDTTSDGTGAATAPGVSRGGEGTAITIKNFQFSPNPIVVKAGTAVTVTNDDDTGFDTGDLEGGANATITIASPGKYAYHCEIHTFMTGTIEAR
jgi:plastocyanin